MIEAVYQEEEDYRILNKSQILNFPVMMVIHLFTGKNFGQIQAASGIEGTHQEEVDD